MASKWVWPVPDHPGIRSYYDEWRGNGIHGGIDIADYGVDGAPIVASRAGKVYTASCTCSHDYGKDYSCECGGGYGNWILIDHEDDWYSVYAHAKDVLVDVGEYVKQGQQIGTVGSTGYSTGAHLHFEIQQGWLNKVNPLYYVNSNNTLLLPSDIVVKPVVSNTANKLGQFLSVAESKLNTRGDWTWKTSGLAAGQPWCAAFVVACAKTVGGLLGVVIPNSFNCGDMITIGLALNLGKWLPGMYRHQIAVTPVPGDLQFIATQNGATEYSARHVGIVKEVKDGVVYAIAGNSGTWNNNTSYVKIETRSVNDNEILGYFRPSWGKVGGGYITAGSQLYPEVNTREDAFIRQIGYLDSSYKPSISVSNLRLSVINYTSTLAELFSSGMYNFAGIASAGQDNIADSSNLGLSDASSSTNNRAKQVFKLIQAKGLNAAASIGIVANIFHESSFDTSAKGDYNEYGVPTSFGLCQWHNDRGVAMKNFVGADWANNLSGQIDYLWDELTSSSYGYILSYLQNAPNTLSGATACADYFVRNFEVPANVDNEAVIRMDTASKYWKSITTQLV